MNRILVTGATGQLGKEVVNQLLNKTDASNLAVMVRDASKVEELKTKGVDIRTGDYNDYPSLVKAFKGIDKLYFVSGSDHLHRIPQHKNVVNAAKEAGVNHVVYTSAQRKNETDSSPVAIINEAHIQTENWLKASGMTYTILKHAIYLDMVPVFLGEQIMETGVANLPAGEGKVAFTLRADMAEVAAVILTSEGHENKIYDITNDKAVSFGEIVADISQITGKNIVYVSTSQEEYIQALSSAGLPIEYAKLFAGFVEAFKQQELDQTNNTIETLIGRKPVSVAQFLKQVYPGR